MRGQPGIGKGRRREGPAGLHELRAGADGGQPLIGRLSLLGVAQSQAAPCGEELKTDCSAGCKAQARPGPGSLRTPQGLNSLGNNRRRLSPNSSCRTPALLHRLGCRHAVLRVVMERRGMGWGRAWRLPSAQLRDTPCVGPFGTGEPPAPPSPLAALNRPVWVQR